jgi:serine/threonine protein phosphatase PrpC
MTERIAEPAQGELERREGVSWAVRSVASDNHPNENEDAVLTDEEHGVAGVFDGMGGHLYGREASQAAVDAVERKLAGWDMDATVDANDLATARASLANLLDAAHRRVLDRGDELYRERYLKLPPDERGKKYLPPQTTGVIALLREGADGRKFVVVAHTGDSRAWLVRADGTLDQIMPDHDYLATDWARHELEEKFGVQLTESAVARYRTQLDEVPDESGMPDALGKFLFRARNVVTGSLGTRTGRPPVDTVVAEVRPGDIILLTSDGIDNLPVSRIRELAALASGPDELVEMLTREAHEVSAEAPRRFNETDPVVRARRDDITAVATIVT